jgi:hypothetical protein
MATYEIIVKRSGHSGTLTFSQGDVSVSTTCWWDLDVEIDAKSDGYLSYATRLAHKKDSVTGEKRPGIWLGKNVKYAHGTKSSNEIFIHEGNDASWSDGCIVAKRGEVLKIWNAINPKETATVLIKVTDEDPARGHWIPGTL